MRKLRNILLVQLFFFFGNSILVNAQLTQTPRMTTGGSGYLEYLPPDYATNPTRKYPILFFLHGTGETGSGSPSDLNKVKNAGPPQKIQGGHNMCFVVNGVEECFIVISPQLGPSKGGWWPNVQGEIFDYILNGPHNYRIDRNRIYLTGLSLGGQGVYMGAGDSNLPDIFAAASPIAAFANGNGCNISARKIPMWGFHGQSDGTIQYGAGWTEFHRILWCTTPLPTAEYIWTPYPGVGHNAWDNAFRTDHSLHNPNLYEWLLSKSKSTLPQARAGTDITMTLPTSSTNIVGSGTDAGGSIASYAWTQLDGASAVLANIATSTLSVSGLTAGVYNFRLTVIDNEGNSAADDVKVTVYPAAVNLPPTVTTGSDITITLPTHSTNIVATASDNDGTIANYAWVQESGPTTATLSGIASATLSVSNLAQGTYSFRITVRDDDNATATSLRSVIVNPMAINLPPTASAGSDKTVNLPTSSTNIVGSGSDPEGGVLTYLWEKTGGPTAALVNITAATLTVNSLIAGIYTFKITVTDNKGVTATDDVTVTVIAANQPPSASAGNDIILTLPTNSSNIIGSGNDLDGSVIAYGWSQQNGPNTAVLTNATSATVTASGLIQGIYTFRLTVTDNNNATSTDDVRITVNAAAVNNPPTASAGGDKTITLPLNFIVLNGSGLDDGSIASYSWIKFSGPTATLTNENTANLTASVLLAGSYTFRLTVTDNLGVTAFDDVDVVVQPEVVNQSPVASAGSDVVITLPTTQASLNGSGLDNDGTIASYLWTQVGGAATSLNGQNTPSLQITGLTLGAYIFRLTVTDNKGASHFDEVKITVTSTNIKPIADAGDDIFINLPTTSTMVNGSGSDVDGTVASYSWALITGSATLTNENTSSLTLSGLAAGVYNLRLTVTDDDGETGVDEVKVTVNSADLAPTAIAGDNKSITLPTNSINLTGSGTDPEGPIVGYLWERLSGPSATLTNANTPMVTVTVTTPGTVVLRLTVTDNSGNTDFDDVQLVINAAAVNQQPTASAGTNQTITLPVNSTEIQGGGTDPDGVISSYLWIKFSGPAALLTNANTSLVSVSNLTEGTYVFRLTVTDNGGLTATRDVTVNVFPQTVNQTPTANADGDRALTLPTNSITLFGSGSDADGSITTYGWTKLSGPAATLANETTPNLSLTNLIAGAYVFRLTVTDNNAATAVDDVILTVNAIGVNQLPLSNAGPDRILVLPTNAATLAGSGSDGDGSINNYLWEILGGPPATLTNASKANLSVSELSEGTYTFALTVTDNVGAMHTDEMTLLVLSAGINQTPSVNAGADVSLILPKNNTTLKGSASDPDGTVESYAWIQISGGPSTMTDIATPTLLLTNMVEGRYVYRLTVTDDDGAIGSDEITVDVLPLGTNSPPVANAGPDLSLKLPANSILINGVGNDSDGTIATYEWTKLTGPTVTLLNTATQTLSVSNLIEGTYSLRLKVTDNNGLSATADVNIVVLPASFNQSPIANAGGNVFLTLPESTTTLNGSGNDPDGTIASYLWTRRAGPTTVTESGNATATVSLSGLVVGTYVYRITVTDNTGGTAFDETIITVVDENTQIQNDAPEADAGEDQIIPIGTVSTRLIGTYEDSGLIDRVIWSQLSGGEIVLNGVDNDTLLISNLTKGTYLFNFTVIDALNVSDSDEVMVTVSDHIKVDSKIFFSPNGDGQNDVWVLDPDTAKIENCRLVIFNSRGTKVFEAAPYQNNWNGTHNGQALPEDVYYYVLNCGGGKNSGSITILR